MVIVSDTSAISNLLIVNKLHIIKGLFGQAVIPPAVQQELSALKKPNEFILAAWPWIQVRPLSDYAIVRELLIELDLGESEAIALAEELGADTLLIDEAKGRKIASERGIQVTGLLGVLLASKANGFIQQVVPVMDELIEKANFRISSSLYQLLRREAGEE